MYDVVGLGEVLIDFTYAGISEGGQKLFEQNPGGAPANLLTVITHMGKKAAMIGKVGNDMHGRFLIDTLNKENIDTDAVIMDDNYFTTLAFVGISPEGEREFSFSRKPGADTMLCESEVDEELLKNTKIFHIGSLSLTSEPARTATYKAVKTAKEAGAIISYDPNYRASLWESEDLAVKEMRAMMKWADMVKVSDEESLLITGQSNYQDAASTLLAEGPAFVAVTLGSEGVHIFGREEDVLVPAFSVNAVDTTGAGDSFWGGFLYSFLEEEKSLNELGEKELEKFAFFGNATAGLCVQKRGGIPAIPYLCDVKKMIG